MKGIKETPIISIHAVSPLNMIGPTDFLQRVMPSGMAFGGQCGWSTA